MKEARLGEYEDEVKHLSQMVTIYFWQIKANVLQIKLQKKRSEPKGSTDSWPLIFLQIKTEIKLKKK